MPNGKKGKPPSRAKADQGVATYFLATKSGLFRPGAPVILANAPLSPVARTKSGVRAEGQKSLGSGGGGAITAFGDLAPPAVGAPPVNTALPAITGTAQVGQILTATNGSWTGAIPISYAYQWQRNAGPPFTPAALIGLAGWWDASVAASLGLTGSNVNTWADQSGGSHTMNWTVAHPIYGATAFNTSFPGVSVDAVHIGNAMETTSFPMGTGNTLTFWYVGRTVSVNAATGGRIISYRGAGGSADWNNVGSFGLALNNSNLISETISRNSTAISTNVSADANHRIIGIINGGGVQTLYVDGVLNTLDTMAGNWASPGTLAIGAEAVSHGNPWGGIYAEIGIARGDNTASVSQLDTYLKNKWGL